MTVRGFMKAFLKIPPDASFLKVCFWVADGFRTSPFSSLFKTPAPWTQIRGADYSQYFEYP